MGAVQRQLPSSWYPESNERLMFYFDSALLAYTGNKDGTAIVR